MKWFGIAVIFFGKNLSLGFGFFGFFGPLLRTKKTKKTEKTKSHPFFFGGAALCYTCSSIT